MINNFYDNNFEFIPEVKCFYDKKENLTYSPKPSGKNDKRKKSVIQYTINGELVREYKSATETEKYGFNRSCVSACCRGKKGMKTHKGYVWKYKE